MFSLRVLVLAAMTLSFAAISEGSHAADLQVSRTKQIGQTKLGFQKQWHYVNTRSCARFNMNGDHLRLTMSNNARADIDAVDVVFGNGKRQRIRIGKRVFTPRNNSTQWKNLRGNKRSDRCIRGVWIWGKTVRSSFNRAHIKVKIRDVIGR